MKKIVQPLINCLLVLFLIQGAYGQEKKETFFTLKTFHSTTFVEINLPLSKIKNLKIKLLDSKSKNVVFTKDLKSINSSRFKLDLSVLEKGEYIMVFMDGSGEILKEVITSKIK